MKKIIISTIFILILIFIITSYTSAENIKSNVNLEKAIVSSVKVTNNGNRYIAFYEDINGGTNNEVLVYLWGPDFSGTGGDTLLVFSEDNGEYSFISKTTIVNMPIIISNSKTNGFNDIIVYVTGGGVKNGFHTVLKNQDGRYPLNPSVQPKVDLDKIHVKKMINVNINQTVGEELKL